MSKLAVRIEFECDDWEVESNGLDGATNMLRHMLKSGMTRFSNKAGLSISISEVPEPRRVWVEEDRARRLVKQMSLDDIRLTLREGCNLAVKDDEHAGVLKEMLMIQFEDGVISVDKVVEVFQGKYTA